MHFCDCSFIHSLLYILFFLLGGNYLYYFLQAIRTHKVTNTNCLHHLKMIPYNVNGMFTEPVHTKEKWSTKAFLQ